VWKTIIVTGAIVLERNYNSQQTVGNKRGQKGQKPMLYSVAELSWDLKLQESYTSLSLLLPTLKWLSSGQHTAPTNHQDKKNLPDQNPVSVLFLAVVFGDNSGVANNDTSLCTFLLHEIFVKIYVHQLPW
jgi:hypothetical protein